MLKLRVFDDNDVVLVETWLHKEHVKKWYEIPYMGITIEDWMNEIKARHDEYRWITYLIVQEEDRPIGFCQYYKCEDSGDEDFGTLPIKGSYGIDYLIGEEECLGKGKGKEIIGLLTYTIFAFPDAERVTADIDLSNKASGGALLSCGFELLDADGSRYVINKSIHEAGLR